MEQGYNLREVAAMFGLKVRTIRQWVHDGRLKAVKPRGTKQWIVSEDEILRIRRENADKC